MRHEDKIYFGSVRQCVSHGLDNLRQSDADLMKMVEQLGDIEEEILDAIPDSVKALFIQYADLTNEIARVEQDEALMIALRIEK